MMLTGGSGGTPSGTRKSQNMTECVPVPTSEHVAEIVGRQGKTDTRRTKPIAAALSPNLFLQNFVHGDILIMAQSLFKLGFVIERHRIISSGTIKNHGGRYFTTQFQLEYILVLVGCMAVVHGTVCLLSLYRVLILLFRSAVGMLRVCWWWVIILNPD